MSVHVKKVIGLKGGNEYRKGSTGQNIRLHNSVERQIAYRKMGAGKRLEYRK